MNANIKIIYSLYLKPRILILLLSLVLLSGILALIVCRSVQHRYAVTALFKVAEIGTGGNSNSPLTPFSPFASKPQNSLRLDALSYLEFKYLPRNPDARGVRLAEAKELKTAETIQLVAEGPDLESIEEFLKVVLEDLQLKYKPSIDSALAQGSQEVKFLNREIASLETLKSQLENGIRNVGPAPALVSQMMEINQSMVRLKQDFFLKSSLISSEKIHNFKLDTLRPVSEGAPVWPKTRQTISLSMLTVFLASAYGVFLHDLLRNQSRSRSTGLRQESHREPLIRGL